MGCAARLFWLFATAILSLFVFVCLFLPCVLLFPAAFASFGQEGSPLWTFWLMLIVFFVSIGVASVPYQLYCKSRQKR
jgi:hypothetical protein